MRAFAPTIIFYICMIMQIQSTFAYSYGLHDFDIQLKPTNNQKNLKIILINHSKKILHAHKTNRSGVRGDNYLPFYELKAQREMVIPRPGKRRFTISFILRDQKALLVTYVVKSATVKSTLSEDDELYYEPATEYSCTVKIQVVKLDDQYNIIKKASQVHEKLETWYNDSLQKIEDSEDAEDSSREGN